MLRLNSTALAVMIGLGVGFGTQAHAQQRYGIGEEPSAEQISGWDIDVRPDGAGLPGGRGSVSEGQQIYEAKCVACHGVSGEEGPMDRLVGGKDSLDTSKPVKTVGSYWPYAATLFDYVHRAMPFDQPQSLADNEVYAVSAYILHLNGLVPEDAVLDARSLPQVQMPNEDGFFGPDPRPDVANTRCMQQCEPLVSGGGADKALTPDQVQ
ncbi:c-type cytochrome [Aestuariivirga sp.]|uniref:c-type cytochrome n=1 Tax=Aestuariivirga sp. TaxID=2650926 RepID=UPI00391AF014